MRRKLIIFAALALMLIPFRVWADDDGGTESVFSIGAGARAMGLGNAYTALAEDATAVYYNPAGLPFLSSQQISFLHTVLFAGTVYDFASYVYPHSDIGGFGIAAMRIGTDDIGRRDRITDLGRFSASQMQFLISFGRRIDEHFAAGATLKLAHHSIDDYSAYGYGLDVAGRALLTEKLRAGFLFQDMIGARMRMATFRERTPFTFRTGLAFETGIEDSPFTGVASLDLDKPEKRNVKLRAGLEVRHTSGLALRGGYDRDNFTLGMGLIYQQLTFDYAYKFIDNLGDSHRFSLSFSFGATSKERQMRQAEEASERQASFIQADREASLQREMKLADDYYNQGQLDSALAAYYRADAFADSKTKRYIDGRITGIRHLQAEQQPMGAVKDARAAEIIREATGLMEKGALKAARDVVDAAIANKIDAAELFVLRREIAFRIDEDVKTLMEAAGQSFDQGDYIDAYNQYNRVLALAPNNTAARDGSRAAKIQIDIAQHLKLAMDYYDQNRYVLSQREFNTVLQLSPGNETARRYLRMIEDSLRDTGTQAEKDLRQDQEMWQIYLEGVEAYRAGDFKRAIELWDKVLSKYPTDKMTLENKRQAELRVKD